MIELVRFGMFDDRTLGRLTVDGTDFYTVEKPWKENIPFESCIPNNFYKMGRVDSPKFGDVWEIKNVVGRTHILLHVGNSADDVVGCVAVGSAVFPGLSGVSSSRRAMARFDALMAGKTTDEIIIRSGVLT
jgi:hypothetical protein